MPVWSSLAPLVVIGDALHACEGTAGAHLDHAKQTAMKIPGSDFKLSQVRDYVQKQGFVGVAVLGGGIASLAAGFMGGRVAHEMDEAAGGAKDMLRWGEVLESSQGAGPVPNGAVRQEEWNLSCSGSFA